MAKTYEELRALGWSQDPRDPNTWWHTTPIFGTRQAGESDAEFRERLEAATPRPELVPELVEDKYVPTALQKHWFAVLRETERQIAYKHDEIAALLAHKAMAQQMFRDASLWNLSLYTHLNSLGHVKLEAVGWDVVQSFIDDKRYLIQHLNWSGDDVWKVFFYEGTKRNPHRNCVGTAVRVGWQDMEIIRHAP